MSYTRKPGATVASALALSIHPPLSWPGMTPMLLTGGRVIDPASQRDESADVLLKNGKVAAVGRWS